MNKLVVTHTQDKFVHTFPTSENASEQGFSWLSTEKSVGYYYYLYIQETRSQANPTGLSLKPQTVKTQVTKNQMAVQDFQLKKKRVTA
jgi:hypothetical protein